MTSKHRSLSIRARLALTVVASVAGSLLMAGCGLGDSPIATNSTTSAASFGGKINGGPNPIAGATVKLFTTGTGSGNATNGGYGVGSYVQEASTIPGHSAGYDTAADGSFSFQGGYPCPANQFLYIVSVGGNTGAGYNSKTFLVAALGRCADLFSNGQYTGGFIYLNELSTVAAAYALGNFTTITGNDIFAQVGIGAPTSNNATVGCVANGTTCPTTSAAGLRHAFQNAVNLVNPFSPAANATLPTNSAALVPQQLINSIANTVVACVNSNGNSNACTVLFGATNTDPVHSNTFQALINLAKNPTLAGTIYATSDFIGAATPQTQFYQPFLASAPPDFSISINYPKLLGKTTGVQGLTYPVSGSLDINDNYYIGNFDSATPTKSNAASFQSNGTLVSFTADDAINLDAYGASADAVGNLYLVGYTPLPTRGGASIADFAINTTTGAITTPTSTIFYVGTDHPIAAAVDRGNNLWFGSQANDTIAQLPAAHTDVNYVKGFLAPVTAVAIDPDQNVWITNSATGPLNVVGVLQNTSVLGTPTYNTSSYLSASIPNLSVSGITFVTGSPYTAYVANSVSTPGFTTVTPTVSGTEVTGLNVSTHVSGGSGPLTSETDGNGIIWSADGANVVKFTPGGTVLTVSPCTYAATNASTNCNGIPYSGIDSVSIDAAGTVWFLSPGTGTANEMIGAAAPTVPLLSLGTLGKP